MIQLFEEEKYEKEYLRKSFKIDQPRWEEIFHQLLKKGIVSNEEEYIKFKYVGIVIIDKFTVFIFPKYLKSERRINQEIEIKTLMNLFNNFIGYKNLDNNVIEDVGVYSQELENKFISIVLSIIEDYVENGIYYDEIDSVERDGSGEINWDRTIDEVMPFNIKGNLLYPEVITNCVANDFHYIISKIHRIVIKECIDFINDTGLAYIIDYEVYLNPQFIDESIDIEVLRYEIEKEIRIQFNDQKKRVLQLILAYLDEKSDASNEKILLYGTRNFKFLWEKLCSKVFNNQFIRDGSLSKYNKFMLLPPKWSILEYEEGQILDSKEAKISEDNNEISTKKNQLNPDVLIVVEFEGKKYILILDAKYYNIHIENDNGKLKIINNPGIGDITKQYFYDMALANYKKKNNITDVINVFLFPATSQTRFIGKVKLDFMDKYPDIMLMKLNVQEMVQMYSQGKFYNEEDIKSLFVKQKSKIDKIMNESKRLKIIDFLQWNDRHGCYSDENCDLEGANRLSYDDAIKFFFRVINEDFYYSKVDNIFELSYEEVINYAKENGFYEGTMNKLNQLLESDRPDEDLYNELICSLGSRADSDRILLDVDLHTLTQKIAYISDIGNSFSNLLKPHLESYANLSTRISKTFEPLSESLSSISESLNLLASSIEQIGSLSWGIDFNYEQFTDNQKSLAQRMVRNGWYFTGNLPPISKELLSINDKEFNLALCDFYDSESEYMFNRILETFPHRKHILAKIEKAHNNKDYELCIPTMLSQADGISYELFNVSLFSKDKLKQPKTKNQKQIKFDEDNIMDILFITQLSITGILNQDVFAKPKFFNRHSVIHGTDVHYNKKQNSLRCLSILYFLAEVKDRKEELNQLK